MFRKAIIARWGRIGDFQARPFPLWHTKLLRNGSEAKLHQIVWWIQNCCTDCWHSKVTDCVFCHVAYMIYGQWNVSLCFWHDGNMRKSLSFVSACCVGNGNVKNSKAFRKFLPLVVKNLLSLADSLMIKALRVILLILTHSHMARHWIEQIKCVNCDEMLDDLVQINHVFSSKGQDWNREDSNVPESHGLHKLAPEGSPLSYCTWYEMSYTVLSVKTTHTQVTQSSIKGPQIPNQEPLPLYHFSSTDDMTRH